ncbi:hypothetical protein ACJJTC_015044 [Scirpophaga incertulas]
MQWIYSLVNTERAVDTYSLVDTERAVDTELLRHDNTSGYRATLIRPAGRGAAGLGLRRARRCGTLYGAGGHRITSGYRATLTDPVGITSGYRATLTVQAGRGAAGWAGRAAAGARPRTAPADIGLLVDTELH